MRSAAIALAGAAWLASACSRSNTISPGPSVAGEWAATDTTQRVMVLNLKQTGTHVSGSGTVGGTPLAGTPADFAKLIVDETDKAARIVKFAGTKAG